MSRQGVIFIPDSTVINVEQTMVELDSGVKLDADILVWAIGGKPNISLVEGLRIKHGGILVDEYMRTSRLDVYAGGDIATVRNIVTGGYVRSTMWPDAMKQGMYAAYSMCGVLKPYSGVVSIASSNFYGMTFVSCGLVASPPVGYEVLVDSNADYYHKFLVHNNILKGFLMVNNVKKLGLLRKMLLDQGIFSLSDFKSQ